MNKFVVEFFGTLLLVFAIVYGYGAIEVNNTILFIAVSYMVLIFIGAPHSGAHFNPAITLANFIRGKLNASTASLYFIAQLVGAMLGAAGAAWLVSNVEQVSIPVATANLEFFPAIWSELLGSFILAFVMLQSRTIKTPINRYWYGIIMALFLGVLIYFLREFSGGSFNPAVALGVSSVKMAFWADIWLYILPTIGGGALAAFVYLIFNGKD